MKHGLISSALALILVGIFASQSAQAACQRVLIYDESHGECYVRMYCDDEDLPTNEPVCFSRETELCLFWGLCEIA